MTAALRGAVTPRRELAATEVRFQETPYGIVKRIRVILDWVDQVADRASKQSLTVLDYGCGTGDHITFPLAQSGHDVLGVDVHGPSILEARRRYTLPNLTFRVGELKDLMDEGLSFDLIVCSEVLEHLHNPDEFLRGLRSLLRPGGGLIITTPNGYGSFEMLCRLERILRRIGVHHGLERLYEKGRQLSRRLQGHPVVSTPSEKLSGGMEVGFLNKDSVHVQFFRLRTLERLFSECDFCVVARRARTLLCGPYVDVAFRLLPWRQALLLLNNRLADLLPFTWAADWMFLLEPKEGIHP